MKKDKLSTDHNIDYIFREDLTREEILNHINKYPQLCLEENDIDRIEGYYSNGDIPKFGYLSARTTSFPTLYHELAHAIELVDTAPDRLLLSGFGMHCESSVPINGQRYSEPFSVQATDRECKVVAIQSHLLSEIFNFDSKKILEKNIKDTASSLYLMHDNLNIKVDKKLNHKEKQKARQDWIDNRVREHHSSYKQEDVIKKLFKVMNVRHHYKEFKNDDLKKNAFYYFDIDQLINLDDTYSKLNICRDQIYDKINKIYEGQQVNILKEEQPVLDFYNNFKKQIISVNIKNGDLKKPMFNNEDRIALVVYQQKYRNSIHGIVNGYKFKSEEETYSLCNPNNFQTELDKRSRKNKLSFKRI
jgi:hypothetical protein